MKTFALASTLWLLAVSAQAATLTWDVQPYSGGPLTIERSDTPTGTFAMVATVPQGTTQYILTPGLWGHYRVSNEFGESNTVQFSADLYAGPVLDRLDTLEARVTETVRRIEAIEALELGLPSVPPPPPTPTSTFTITHIDATHIRIVCNGVGITTLGSGTSRTMECRQ